MHPRDSAFRLFSPCGSLAVIYVDMKHKVNGSELRGRLNLIDLAGSENVKESGVQGQGMKVLRVALLLWRIACVAHIAAGVGGFQSVAGFNVVQILVLNTLRRKEVQPRNGDFCSKHNRS